MARRVRAAVNEWAILVAGLGLLAAAGPTLLLDDLTPHTVLGTVFALALVVHLGLHRDAVATLPGGWGARRRPRWVRAADAVREATVLPLLATSVTLAIDAPGETLHVVAGGLLGALTVLHVAVHRRWIGRRLRRISGRAAAPRR